MDKAQSKVGDPAEIAAENERLDSTFARLIQEATPKERAEWNGYDTEQKRDLARTVMEQEKDQHIEDQATGGNRIPGRKP